MSQHDDEGLTPDGIAARAAREATHAHDRLDGLRDRLDWHAAQLSQQIAAVEKAARDRGHRLTDALVVLTADVAHLRDAIGPEPNSRASIADMSPEDVRALASRGLRPAVHAMLVQHAAERAESLARAKATETKLARVERGQSRSTSLLAALFVAFTALQESGAISALIQYLTRR